MSLVMPTGSIYDELTGTVTPEVTCWPNFLTLGLYAEEQSQQTLAMRARLGLRQDLRAPAEEAALEIKAFMLMALMICYLKMRFWGI